MRGLFGRKEGLVSGNRSVTFATYAHGNIEMRDAIMIEVVEGCMKDTYCNALTRYVILVIYFIWGKREKVFNFAA